jgi:hypothetical protein
MVCRAIAKSFGSIALYVIASEAKQSPTLGIEIASSLRSSQGHQSDLPSDFAFALKWSAACLHKYEKVE